MKHLFKTFLFLLVFTGFVTSCSNEDDAIKYGEAKLLSFGFYAVDNEGVLFQDYVSVDSTSAAITVNLPEEVDKTKLVARFTTTDKDVVTVGGVVQESRVTKNDFSVPVDFIITEGTSNTKVTITVGKQAAFVWSKLPAFTADSTSSFVMKVDPKTGIPYVLFKQKRTTSADEKASLIKFNNGAWDFVGTSAGISEGQIASYLDLTFDSIGTPYVIYPDYTAISGTITQLATVRSFKGSSWNDVGTKGVTAGKVTYTGLSFAPDNSLMAFCAASAATATLAKRELGISVFSNNIWTMDTKMPNRGSDLGMYYPIAKLVKGALYLGMFNVGLTPQTFSVYKFENGAWSVIADKKIQENATNLNLYDFDMDVDLKGNIYVATADDADVNTKYRPRVSKYDALTKTWSNLGASIVVDFAVSRKFDLAVSPNGTAYLLYRNDSKFPTIVSFDNDTKNWSDPIVLDTFESTDLWLDFASTGIGYAVYTNSNTKIIAQKFDVPVN
jgi:hypothetical protein